jgi:hypothetical protein
MMQLSLRKGGRARADKKSDLGMDFTPSKKSRITQEESVLDSTLVFKINPNDRVRSSVLSISSAAQPIHIQGAAWSVVVDYIVMLDNRLPALKSVLSAMSDR